ncbi:MAG TPA: hypothetical protein DEA08_20445 [Planctomycetes bacterium]|nr:hypothetical protein [Planctomycetota bacterium]
MQLSSTLLGRHAVERLEGSLHVPLGRAACVGDERQLARDRSPQQVVGIELPHLDHVEVEGQRVATPGLALVARLRRALLAAGLEHDHERPQLLVDPMREGPVAVRLARHMGAPVGLDLDMERQLARLALGLQAQHLVHGQREGRQDRVVGLGREHSPSSQRWRERDEVSGDFAKDDLGGAIKRAHERTLSSDTDNSPNA